MALSCGVACDSDPASKTDATPAPTRDAKDSAGPDSSPTPTPASDSSADPTPDPAAKPAGGEVPTFEPTRAVLEFSNPSIESNPTTRYSLAASSGERAAALLRDAVATTTVNGSTPLAVAIVSHRAKNTVALAALAAKAPSRREPGAGGGLWTLTLYDGDGVLFVDTKLDDYVLEGRALEDLRKHIVEHGHKDESDDSVKPSLAPAPSAPPEPAAGASVVFDLGPLVDGRFTPIATLTFDAAQHGTLELFGSNPKHAALEKAWTAAATLEEVSVKRGRESRDGTHELVGVTTARGGKDFPVALANYVADEVGMFAVSR